MSCTGWLAFGQSPGSLPRFEAADVHVSDKTRNPIIRTGQVRGGRYEVRNATMVDLIRIAYGFDADKVLGGPSWLEMDRFDVIAKVPGDSTSETQKLMLQALLEDRCKLVVHKDTKPLPNYVLTVGEKLHLKKAGGSEESACKLNTDTGAPSESGNRISMVNSNRTVTTINLGPGMAVRYLCRNMSLEEFAAALRGMAGASLGPNPVLNETGLEGRWNFDISYSVQLNGPMMGNAGDRVSIFDAVDKQLGLKLEEKPVPTPVIVVDSVNRKPTENPPGVAEALPSIPAPTEFEAASIKPGDSTQKFTRFNIQPGGRLRVQGMPLRIIILRAFNTDNEDEVVGLPKFADTDRFDIEAKAPSPSPAAPPMEHETVAPMLRALLVDRFKMRYHTEERPVSAYSLVAVKPIMKKADSTSRTSCKNANPPAGASPGSRVLRCQNVSMVQFADRLQNMAPELNWPVLDATGIEGSWNFTLTFSSGVAFAAGAGRGGEAGQTAGDVPSASEPVGGYDLFEAVAKQLGLKLEKQRRSMPVIVIDHLEKPAEN